jgi:DNA-binding response OmpR family regulator
MARARLLLVEDDAALAELLVWHFEREEFEVEHTPDGEEALLLARESPPDLVLLDWMIEGLSGIEVCRRLRRLPDTANVPIIMLTARGEEEDRVRGLETGADDYVTKPFSPRELVARVGAVLRRVRGAATAISSRAPSTSIFAGFARQSTTAAGRISSAPSARRAMRSTWKARCNASRRRSVDPLRISSTASPPSC